MGFTQSVASQNLGISVSSIQSYERGSRSDKKTPEGTLKAIPIPLLTAWAMAAIANELTPWGGK